jgi:cytochrome c oxidase subunit 2
MLDRLLAWNLAALTALLLLAHLILLYAITRRVGRGVGEQASPAIVPLPGTVRRPALQARLWAALSQPWAAETIPTLLSCLLFAAMAITSEQLWGSLRYQGAAPAAMQVEVVGQQFQWYFRYPGDDARFGLTRPQLVNAASGNPLGLDPHDPAAHDDIVSSVLLLPAGREVDIRLRAHDVIHGFFIPGMRLKQNAVPGLVLHVHFTPTTPGTYPILCTQVCGSGHARMQAVLRVVSPDEFAAWIATRERKLATSE